jgi:hypothetical protein
MCYIKERKQLTVLAMDWEGVGGYIGVIDAGKSQSVSLRNLRPQIGAPLRCF